MIKCLQINVIDARKDKSPNNAVIVFKHSSILQSKDSDLKKVLPVSASKSNCKSFYLINRNIV